MYVSGLFAYELWQGFYVCAEQLFQCAVIEYFSYYRVCVTKCTEHLLAGNELSRFRLLRLLHYLHLAEEYVAYLSWR